MSPNRTRYLSYLCLYHHHLAEFLAQGGHSLSWLIKNTIRNYFIKKISSLMGMISSTSNVIINIFLYLGIFLTMSRWNGLHSSEESITWFFFIWRLVVDISLSKKGVFLGKQVGQGRKNLLSCHRQNYGRYTLSSRQQANTLVPPDAWKLRSDFYFYFVSSASAPGSIC